MSRRAKDFFEDIIATVEHGECFYNRQMLDDLFSDLNDFKHLALKELEKNRKEIENED